MKNFYTLVFCVLINNGFAQTHTFEREVQSNHLTLQLFKNSFDSSLYLWKDKKYGPPYNAIDMAKTDTSGNILTNISFSLGNLNYNNIIVPFSNGFIAGGSEPAFSNNNTDLVRFDYSGNVIWAKSYAAPNGLNSRPVIVDEINNVILSIASPVIGGPNIYPAIIRTDLNGNSISLHGYPVTNAANILPVDLIKLNSGNYLLEGEIIQTGCATCRPVILLELDPALNIVSSNQILMSPGAPGYQTKFIKKPDDGFYVIGNFYNSAPNYDTYGFIINFSPAFGQLWAKYTNNSAGLYGLFFAEGKLTPDGGLIIGGTYTSPSGYDDMMLMKVDSAGNLNWTKLIGESSKDERLSSFIYEPNDAIYLAGNGYDTAQSGSTIDGLFLKTDLSGNTTCGSSSLTVGFNIMNVILNPVSFTISTVTITDSTIATSPLPGFTFVPSCDGVVSGIENNSSYFPDVDLSPNPAKTSFEISFETFSDQPIEIYLRNLLGSRVYFSKEQTAAGIRLRRTKEINVQNLPNGIYFLEVKTKEGVLNKKVVVQH